MKIKWEFVGVDALISRLQSTVAPESLLPVYRKYAAQAERYLKVYPTPPGGSTYDRSGLLGQAWQHDARIESGRVVAEAWNTRSYAPWVQEHEQQAKVHRGRWRTDRMALDEVEDPLKSELGATIVRNF